MHMENMCNPNGSTPLHSPIIVSISYPVLIQHLHYSSDSSFYIQTVLISDSNKVHTWDKWYDTIGSSFNTELQWVPEMKLTPPFTGVFIELNVCIKQNNCSKYWGCRSNKVGKLSRGGGGRADGVSKESRFFCCLEAPIDINTICKIKYKFLLTFNRWL